MAVNAKEHAASAASPGGRWAVGTNVVLSVVLAMALLAAVNWLSSIKNVRKDVATFGSYGLSDRTKQIVSGLTNDAQVWTVYPPKEEDPKQQEVIERLRDYLDELQQFSSKVKVSYVTTDRQREKLVAEISEAFSSESAKHREAIEAFGRVAADLEADLQQRLQAATSLMAGDAWLGDFPLYANIATVMQSDVQSLQQTQADIKELTPVGGIPKYAEAVEKAKTELGDIKSHLQSISQRLAELAALAEGTGSEDSRYIQMLRSVATEPRTLVATLREAVGAEGAPMPENPSVALKAYADRGVQVSSDLQVLVRKVDDFARKFPMVKQHPNWAAPVRMGPLQMRMEVADVLRQAGKTLEDSRLVILGAIDTGDPRQLQESMTAVREDVSVLEQNAAACEGLLMRLADRLASVDDASKTMLDAAKDGALFAENLAAIEANEKQLGDLPEPKLGGIADQLKEDNTVVVEMGGRIRVVSFSEVFPPRESVGGPGSEQEDLGRSFNGDSALSSALLALGSEKPFVTVVLAAFEPPPPQQRSPLMPRPPESWIPSRALTEARKRLEAANFKVVDWNMATTPEPPTPEEGTSAVYVFLPPPPPSPPNPFMQQQQQPEPTFGQAQRDKVRELLKNDACAIFLATWEIRQGGGFFGGPLMTPPYGYGPLLEEDWGIQVINALRITWLEPDRRTPNDYLVNPPKFTHMPATGFGDSELGRPQLGTRFLINDACPLERKEPMPEGVTATRVLGIPDREHYLGIVASDLIHIINQLRHNTSGGKVSLSGTQEHGPFDVMVVAERQLDGKRAGKVVVVGFGGSLRDDYLLNPVVASSDVLKLDPPPTENLDLFVNSLFWLSGNAQWIASGPVPVPRVKPIGRQELTAMRVLVWGGWPALVVLPAIILWYVRRR